MITFSILSASDKERWLPVLFGLLYENMRDITKDPRSFDEQKAEWLAAVSPALEKTARKLVICFADGSPVGFVQYYTSGQLLMIEEIQLNRRCQGTLLFHRLCRYVFEHIHTDISVIEAYSDRQNLSSQKIMKKLGMSPISDDKDSRFIHLRGSLQTAKDILRLG